jgi:hypothetical protein
LASKAGHAERSAYRSMSRQTPNPNVWDGARAYRSCDSGIRNSAVQPNESTLVPTSQIPFQESSSLPSLLIAKSRFTPSGFTANSKPLRLSSYESISSLI